MLQYETIECVADFLVSVTAWSETTIKLTAEQDIKHNARMIGELYGSAHEAFARVGAPRLALAPNVMASVMYDSF